MDLVRTLSFAAAVTVTVGARADEPTVVYVAGTCTPPATTADEVVQILEAELSPVRVARLAGNSVGETEAVLGLDACSDGPPSARISVWRHGQRRERTIVLADAVPGLESRTLALALAEALRDPRVTAPAPAAPEPWSAPRAPTPPPPPHAQPVPDAGRRTPPSQGPALVPHAGLIFRYMPASTTPALGIDGRVTWKRLDLGLLALGAQHNDALGTATLVGIAATASVDLVAFTRTTFLRLGAEFGAAISTGTPSANAVGHTHVAPHVATLATIAQYLPMDGGYDLEGFAGGGFGYSRSVTVEGTTVMSFGGGLITVGLGLRMP
jgi:hypothetical protein